MTTQDAKKIDLIGYFSSLGIEPQKTTKDNQWYCSPFREEKTPSLKIQGNVWYDFGIGEGGTIIDFGVKYFNCSISDFLKLLADKKEIAKADFSSFHQQKDSSGIEIQKVKKLENRALTEYLTNRCIDLEIAKMFCQEMYYVVNDKRYFAICFANDKGGYEIRSKYFKGSTSPKSSTHVRNSQSTLLVVEGFIDFLSWLTLNQFNGNLPFDVLVLNSLSFSTHIELLIDNYTSVELLLDNDDAGKRITAEMQSLYPSKIIDISGFLNQYKDVNEYLTSQKNEQAAHHSII